MKGAVAAAALAAAAAATRRSEAIRANISSTANVPALIRAVQRGNKDYYAARELYREVLRELLCV